jgi:uncharacterized protein (TIGR01777 family)
MKPRLVLAGGSGFLGHVLSEYFCERGWEVVVLTRYPRNQNGEVRNILWDGETLGEWTPELEGAGALINLAGVTVNCRYHLRNRKKILDSRLNSTQVLAEAVARCGNPPEVWLNSSTATIYKHTFGPAWNESGEVGYITEAKDKFSVEVARAWERTFEAAETKITRKLVLRSAMVLGLGRNSVFPMLRTLVRLGLGGSMAGGRQFVSWIHQQDFCRAVEWLIEHRDLAGTFNLAAPNPRTNAEMMRTLRALYKRPFGLPASRWMLEIGAFFLRTETELIVKSRRVAPGRLQASGFVFRFPEMEHALRDLESWTGETANSAATSR